MRSTSAAALYRESLRRTSAASTEEGTCEELRTASSTIHFGAISSSCTAMLSLSLSPCRMDELRRAAQRNPIAAEVWLRFPASRERIRLMILGAVAARFSSGVGAGLAARASLFDFFFFFVFFAVFVFSGDDAAHVVSPVAPRPSIHDAEPEGMALLTGGHSWTGSVT